MKIHAFQVRPSEIDAAQVAVLERRSDQTRVVEPCRRKIAFDESGAREIGAAGVVRSEFDTMGTKDHRYFMDKCLTLGTENPEQAINNADSIAGYVIYNA